MALRYLFARRSALSYVSRLALMGLVLSVAVLVIVLSIVNGFERELRDRVLGVLPHVTTQVVNWPGSRRMAKPGCRPAVPWIARFSALCQWHRATGGQ